MILIKNGTVHDGKGKIFDDIDILIEDGIIKAIDHSIEVSDDVEVFDAKNKEVFPGFIDSLNAWGCIGPGWADNDLNEHSDPVTPEMNVVYAFDQDGMVFQGVFEYGITSAGIIPTISNVIGGQAAVFKTYGNHPYKMLVKEKVGMMASVTGATKKLYGSRNIAPMTKMGAFSLLKEALIKASNYDPSKEETKFDAKCEALQKVLKREIPLLINCHKKAEMDALQLLLKEFSLDVIFVGAFGVDINTAKIKEKKNSVILGDLTNAMSEKNRQIDFESIAKLMEGGVDIAISSFGEHGASGKESLLWNAILCYKYGLKSEEVLKMITSIPAKLLGVDQRIGSIEVGKDADMTIWSANPIESYRAVIEATFINGENVLNYGRNTSCW